MRGADRPADGSAPEPAVSCQKVLGGQAETALEYATIHYRSNLINWGILPFTVATEEAVDLVTDDPIYFPGIRSAVQEGAEKIAAFFDSQRGSGDTTIGSGGPLPG